MKAKEIIILVACLLLLVALAYGIVYLDASFRLGSSSFSISS